MAEGIYKPDANSADPNGSRDRTATFQLINGAEIYGGFAGDETSIDERDWEAYETILNGDLNGDDVGFTNNGENSYHVVTGSGTDETAVLDGFTITASNANGSWPDDVGGGMYNVSSGSSPTVTNCTFSGNSADCGGGMWNYGYPGTCSPTLTNCTFSGNSAGDNGGGMCNDGSSPTLTNCTFSANSAVDRGGGMANYGSSPTLTNCTFSDNSASSGSGMYNQNSDPNVTNCTFSGNSAVNYYGGGMYNNAYSSPTVSNCTFSGNSAGQHGGGMYNYSDSPTIDNCTFSRNSAEYYGGGMYNSVSSSPTVTNCILWGNTAGTGGPEIALTSTDFPSTLTITYSDVQGGAESVYVESGCTLNWGAGNISDDPNFVDPNGPDGIAGTEDDDLHLLVGSPCIDAGDNTALPADTADLDGDGNTTEPIPWDIDSDARVVDGNSDGNDIVDIGSDEVIWDGATGISPGGSVALNPGGGPNDPNTEALVVFDNNSAGDANITVVEMGSTAHPKEQGFEALGKTLRIETSVADGEFFMTVSISFNLNDLNGAEPFTVDLMYWEDPPGKWRHAVKANTDPQQSNPKKNRWQEKYPPDAAPTLAELKTRGMGANGVFWNSVTQQGFVWANVDHTTDFEGLIHNIADFEPDGNVDFVDFAWFAANWMDISCGICNGADLTGDGNVDSYDLKELTDTGLQVFKGIRHKSQEHKA